MKKIYSIIMIMVLLLSIGLVSAKDDKDYEEVGIDGYHAGDDGDTSGAHDGNIIVSTGSSMNQNRVDELTELGEQVRNRYREMNSEEMECYSNDCLIQMREEKHNIHGIQLDVIVMEKQEQTKFLYLFKAQAKNQFYLSETGEVLEQHKNFFQYMYQWKLASSV